MKKTNFDYLDNNRTDRQIYAMMIFAIAAFIIFLLLLEFTTNNGLVGIVAIMAFCLGMIIAIHWLGGIKPTEILDYWDYVKRSSKRKEK